MDSDLPIRMDDASNAVPLTDEADLVIGWRKSRAESWRRDVFSRIYNWMIRRLFGLHVRDVNFAFKLFRRELLDRILLTSEGSFIDAELLLEMKRIGRGSQKSAWTTTLELPGYRHSLRTVSCS